MAKLRRKKVGAFLKSKDDNKPPYLKLTDAIPADSIIRVESKKYQIASLQRAAAGGKLPAKMAEEMLAKLEKMPDFVLGDLIVLQEE